MRDERRPQAAIGLRGAIRLDVLVEPQHIAWVVLFFDLYEAIIVRPIGRTDKLVTRIA